MVWAVGEKVDPVWLGGGGFGCGGTNDGEAEGGEVRSQDVCVIV